MDHDRALEAAREIQLLDSAQLGPVYFHGETMRPFLGEGDLLIVEPVRWDDIRPGDIVTYRNQHKYPTRRVISIDRRKKVLHIYGDNVPQWEILTVPQRDVLGRATARQRSGTWLYASDKEWQSHTQAIMKRDRFTHLRFHLARFDPRRFLRKFMKPSLHG